jgi:hypothetical protein
MALIKCYECETESLTLVISWLSCVDQGSWTMVRDSPHGELHDRRQTDEPPCC